MLIDSPSVMYGTFQRCNRLHPYSGKVLALLHDILGLVEKQGKFLIEVPDELVPNKWMKAVHDDTERALSLMKEFKYPVSDDLSTRNRALFSLIEMGTRDVQRLWATQSRLAVRSLGYALHVIPRLLRTPEEFRPKSYRFCFRIMSTHWDELSLEMREASCTVVGLKRHLAETLIKTPGFCIDLSGSHEDGEKIKVIDDDPWVDEVEQA